MQESTLIDWIADSIISIPKEHREFVILQSFSSLQYIPDSYKRTSVFAIIAAIPHNFLSKELLHEIPYLFQCTSNREYKHIIEKIKKFPAHQRASIIHHLKPIIENIDDPDFRNNIIHTILHIPTDERERTLALATPYLLEIPSGRDRIRILKYIWMIDPYKRLAALEIAKINQALDNRLFIYTVFANPDIRESSHVYIYDLLEATIIDRAKAESLAEKIINLSEKLLLNEEHPLFNRAIEVLTITDPSTLDSFRNAYTLFSHLKKAISSESLIRNSLPNHLFNDRYISFDLAFLQEMGEMKITFDAMPENISPDIFHALFEKMEKRLEQLSLKDQVLAYEYITESFCVSFSDLKNSLLSKHLISSLLRIKGNPSQPLEITSYYLHIIAKKILESSDQCQPPLLLTEQEEMLLAFSSSVQNCPIGQKDGISIFFNRINHLSNRGEATADLLVKIIDNSIQTIFSDILCNKEFIEELIGSRHFSQEAHQTLYLRNRFHKQIGLRHRLSFDPYGAVIDETLLNTTSETMIKKFFAFCTPQKVIAQIKRDIEEQYKKNLLHYSELANFIEKIIPSQEKKNPTDWYHHYLEFESDNPFDEGFEEFKGISENGIVAILIALKYLKEKK